MLHPTTTEQRPRGDGCPSWHVGWKKCLEKGEAALNATPRPYLVSVELLPWKCCEVFELKGYQARIRAQLEKYLLAKQPPGLTHVSRGYSHIVLHTSDDQMLKPHPRAWISYNSSCAHWDSCAKAHSWTFTWMLQRTLDAKKPHHSMVSSIQSAAFRQKKTTIRL